MDYEPQQKKTLDPNKAACPVSLTFSSEGLTVDQELSARFMASFLVGRSEGIPAKTLERLANKSVEAARALIEALNESA